MLQTGLIVGQVLLAKIDHLGVGSPLAFDLVHGGVGLLEKLLGIVKAVAGEGDADAGGETDFNPSQEKGDGQSINDALGHKLGLGFVPEVLTQHDEFISGQAGQRVTGSHHAGDPAAHRDQQIISDLVTMGVVDLFEVVEIHKEDGHQLLGPSTPRQGMFEAFQQQDPIR
jgi:hypothetical protein